jgi:magnesium chelatase family protein
MSTRQVKQFCALDRACTALVSEAMEAMSLSARAYTRILKVARTAADLDGSDTIRPQHITEAVQYRSLDTVPNA